MIVKILILVGLLRLLVMTGKPFLCSGIYGAVSLLFMLLMGVPFQTAVIAAVIGFALASFYFWLLHFLDSAPVVVWWLVAAVGILIGLV